MEVEVMVPVMMNSPADFNFNFDSSNCSSPFITAPSSPQFFFFSAPTSPTRGTSSFFHDSPSSSSVPFHWEQKPGLPKSDHNHQDDFEFNFSGHLEKPSLSSADELFHAGKIRPLKPPPRLQSPVTSPRSKLSPRRKKSDFDPFTEAVKETRRRDEQEEEKQKQRERGRETVSVSGRNRKGSRSLSPLRISDIVCDSEDKDKDKNNVSSSTSNNNSNKTSSFLSSIPFTRKWRFRDFLLFRSASEGRATDKDPLRRKYEEDVRNCSFRSSESSSGSVSKRRGPVVSAHELHYTLNRAASEELKKKTLLPYKQGLLGCLGFNPGMHHISKGIGGSFTTRS